MIRLMWMNADSSEDARMAGYIFCNKMVFLIIRTGQNACNPMNLGFMNDLVRIRKLPAE